MKRRPNVLLRLALTAGALFLLSPPARLLIAAPQETEPDADPVGRLTITGSHVEKIVLADSANRNTTFSADELTEPLSLPPGTWRLRQIRLEQGYQSYIWRDDQIGPIHIEADGTAELNIGAPLTQGIDVKRRGRLFQLSYELKGIGGESYTATRNQPEFTVYKGDKKVGGGRFEYG